MKKQSPELLRFMRAVSTDYSGTVYTNVIDGTPSYFTRFYTPQLKVSMLSNKVLDYINTQDIQENAMSLKSDTLTYLIRTSDLRDTNVYIYNLLQTIILESFSIVYTLEEKPTLLKYVEKSDLGQTKENISYCIDALSGVDTYNSIVEQLNSLYIAIGYLYASIEAIKESVLNNGQI